MQCPVMFCIAEQHEGTGHVDATGDSYNACVHGNLEHWDPCQLCAEGAPPSKPDEMPFFHVIGAPIQTEPKDVSDDGSEIHDIDCKCGCP